MSLKDDLNDLGDDLYREQLIDHYKNPRNAGTLEPADLDHDGDNPTCGDEVHVYARLKGDAVSEIKFRGRGCAISQASASIFYEDARGKRLEDLVKLNVEHIQDLLGITLRPARVKCATLPLVVLKEAIREFQSKGAPKRALPGFGRKEAGA